MFVTPKSEITIGKIKFFGQNGGINSVKISQSVTVIGGTAEVVIPRNFKKIENKGILDYISVGNKAIIRFGYGDNLRTEFVGYVTEIGDGTPIVLKLDDEWYLQKKKDHISKSWALVSLRDVLKFAFPDYNINAIDVTLTGGFIIQSATPFEVIKGLQESYGFVSKLNEEQKTITCFWAYDFSGFNTHTYVFGTRDKEALRRLQNRKLSPNVAKNDLKFSRKEDMKLQITAKAKQRDGKTLSVTIGSKDKDASKRTLNFGYEITTEKALKERAEEELGRLSFDGYTGKIVGFGTPATEPGDALKIVDPENSEREGIYLIAAVDKRYSISEGIRRENTLSYKI